jgi:hypothetical protein
LIMASTGGEGCASPQDLPNQTGSTERGPATPRPGHPEGCPQEAPKGSRYLTRQYLRIPRLDRTHRLDVLMRAAEPDTAE